MSDRTTIDTGGDPLRRVVEAALRAAPELESRKLMLVGAMCRDILHHRLGHTFPTTATHDLDLALALSSWDSYQRLADTFPAVGNTGIRFRIADNEVDLLPFGDVEDPRGVAEPPTRHQTMSVWAFDEIFFATDELVISSRVTISIPTVAGYAAAKLGAWLDRSEYGQVKDAPDIALILFWYAESAAVEDHLYNTDDGNMILVAEELNVPVAAAHLLGADIAAIIETERLAELLQRWPGDLDLLVRELVVRGADTVMSEHDRRRRIAGLTRGLRG